MEHHARLAADCAALLAGLGSFIGWVLGWLPLALTMTASIMSITWLGMQMHDRAERRKREAMLPLSADLARTIESEDE